MKRYFTCCIYAFLINSISIFPIIAQVRVADSLKNILSVERNDSVKVILLRDIGYAYEQTNTMESSNYYLQAISLSKKINNSYQYLAALNDYGNLHITSGKYDTAEIIFKDILTKTNTQTSYILTGSVLANLGNIYKNKNKYILAQEQYMKAIALFEKNNDTPRLTRLYGNMNIVFFDLRQDKQAIEYAEKMYSLAKKNNNNEDIVTALVNLSNSYKRMNEHPKAIALLKESLPLAIELDNAYFLSNIYYNLGVNELEMKKYDTAISNLNKAAVFARTMSNTAELGAVLTQSGRAYSSKGNYSVAINFFNEAEPIVLKANRKNEINELYLNIAETEKLAGNLARAYKYLYKYAQLKDTIYDDATSSKIAELEINYQTEKKEKDILQLQQESKNKTDSIQKTKTLIYILLGSFLTLLLIIFLSYRTYKQKQLFQQQQIKQLQNEKLLLATESILKGQEDERSRLAQDLHDGLGGMLSGVKLTLSAMKGNIILPEESARLFTKAFEQLDSSIGEMRRVAHNMMPEALVKLGLQQALRDYCDGINEVKEIKGLNINCEFHGLENRLDNSTEIIVYRIVQELLNNIIKHANASHVLVQVIKKDTELNITVEDNGNGFTKEEAVIKNGAGLKNIQSRVDYLKGELDIKSTPGKGTSVHINCIV
ncbi:MAG: tetratricopeptide repeat protein [Chitinophagaceae bacterium]